MNLERGIMKQVFVLPIAGALLGVICASSADAQSDDRIAVPLTDPSRPATLAIALFNGSVSVTGYDGNEILITTNGEIDDEDEDDEPVPPNRAGLRRIPNSAIGLTAEETDNTVSIGVDWSNRGIDLEISVPRRTSVHARTHNGEVIRIEGVTGEHELANTNGDIIGVDVRGSAVVASQNGDIEMSFMELTPGKAMSFGSFNGDIEVAFPPTLAAVMRINAGRGDIYTDFEMQLQPQSSVVEAGSERGRKQVRLEREMRLVVGGGGSEIQFKTFNGDIVIRKR
jgi:DUF4097 and DUF4098 domain-containing protein YvlB